MTVDKIKDGWAVIDPAGNIIVKFATNAAAWRWIDRQEGEPVSRSEKVAGLDLDDGSLEEGDAS